MQVKIRTWKWQTDNLKICHSSDILEQEEQIKFDSGGS
jgi:hypothetical protein